MTTSDAPENAWREDWDARADADARLYAATWYAKDDATWEEGTRRDAAYLLSRLPADLPASRRALDLGCGPGRLLPAMASRFDEVVACDVSPRMLELARETVGAAPDEVARRVSFVLGDGRSLDGLEDASFAAVLVCAVFIHIDEATIRGYLGEVARVLAPGGVLAASFNAVPGESPPDPAAEPPAVAPGAASGADESAAPLPPPDIDEEAAQLVGGRTWDGKRWTRTELAAALADAGFGGLDWDLQGDVHVVFARRPA